MVKPTMYLFCFFEAVPLHQHPYENKPARKKCLVKAEEDSNGVLRTLGRRGDDIYADTDLIVYIVKRFMYNIHRASRL